MSSKCIVVDASVLIAAALTNHPESSASRRVLDDIKTICHKMVMTSAIKDEFDRNLSRIDANKASSVYRWTASMKSKKKLCWISPQEDLALRDKIDQSTVDSRAMAKDVHLIEAAMHADKIVISLDGKAYDHFTELSKQAKHIKAINWKNPIKEDLSQWLRKGAKAQPAKGLGGNAKEGVAVEVRVQPRASRAQVEGVRDGVLRVRLTAPTADGAANEQLLEVLSKHYKVPKSSMEIVRGASSRNKLVLFRGVESLAL